MAYKPKNKDVTLAEFQAWLEGVEEVQPKDWCPDAKQWKLIRNKIRNIVVPEPVVPEAPMHFPGQPAPRPVAAPSPAVPSSIPGLPPAPEVPGSIPDFEVTAPTEAAAKLLAPSSPARPAKTPDIESDADGKVTSPFA